MFLHVLCPDVWFPVFLAGFAMLKCLLQNWTRGAEPVVFNASLWAWCHGMTFRKAKQKWMTLGLTKEFVSATCWVLSLGILQFSQRITSLFWHVFPEWRCHQADKGQQSGVSRHFSKKQIKTYHDFWSWHFVGWPWFFGHQSCFISWFLETSARPDFSAYAWANAASAGQAFRKAADAARVHAGQVKAAVDSQVWSPRAMQLLGFKSDKFLCWGGGGEEKKKRFWSYTNMRHFVGIIAYSFDAGKRFCDSLFPELLLMLWPLIAFLISCQLLCNLLGLAWRFQWYRQSRTVSEG